MWEHDLVEAPGPAGRAVLGRLGPERTGPAVLCGCRRRIAFAVAPGAGPLLPEVLELLDWGGLDLGISPAPHGCSGPRRVLRGGGTPPGLALGTAAGGLSLLVGSLAAECLALRLRRARP